MRRRRLPNGTWVSSGIFTQGSRIVQDHLGPGTTYDFQFRGIAGGTGYSGWSDLLSHMAT